MQLITLDELTNRELAKIEDATGKLLEDLIINGRMSHSFKCAIAWISLARTNPALAFEEVLEKGIEFFDVIVDAEDNPKKD
jgi:hypothetical protein